MKQTNVVTAHCWNVVFLICEWVDIHAPLPQWLSKEYKRHSCVQGHGRRSTQHSRPAARRSRSRSHSGRRHRHSRDGRSRSRSAGRSHRRRRDHRRRHSHDRHARRHRSRDRHHSPSRSASKPKNFKEQLKAQLFSSSQPVTPAASTVTLLSSGPATSTSVTASTAATVSAAALEAKRLRM